MTAGTAAIGLEGPGAAAILTALGAPVPASDYRHEASGRCDGSRCDGDGPAWCTHLLSGRKIGRHDAPIGGGGNGRGKCGVRAAGAHREWQAAVRRRYSRDVAAAGDAAVYPHGVSFNKGCYLGQEIVERIRAQGRVNKKLMRVVLEGADAPPSGTKTTVDGAEAEVTSAVVSPASGEVVALSLRTPALIGFQPRFSGGRGGRGEFGGCRCIRRPGRRWV